MFVGTKTILTYVCGMKSDKQLANSLEDNIMQRREICKLTSDAAQHEIITRVKDILRALFIDDWKPEAYHQHQYFAKRRNQTIKRQNNTLLDRTSAPEFAWLLAMCYVLFVLNHAQSATIKNTNLNTSTGSTCDMSPLIFFHFWEPVLFNTENTSFPSDSPEERGRFVGIS